MANQPSFVCGNGCKDIGNDPIWCKCEVIKYCSEECRQSHLEKHKDECGTGGKGGDDNANRFFNWTELHSRTFICLKNTIGPLSRQIVLIKDDWFGIADLAFVHKDELFSPESRMMVENMFSKLKADQHLLIFVYEEYKLMFVVFGV